MDSLSLLKESYKHYKIVGREYELENLWACLYIGHHVLLEGPAGVGKTILAKAVSMSLGRGFYRVDGDARFTESKLVGNFDPPSVMSHGYDHKAFLKGPLTRAMEEGSILFINELNRMPEGVQNLLLPPLDENQLIIPHVGQIIAKPGFAIVATMNPKEFVATSYLSEALLDRFEHIHLDHQSREEEIEITRFHVKTQNVDEKLISMAVDLVRNTRNNPSIRRGASIRAAISIVEIATALGGISFFDRAVKMAIPNRIEVHDLNEYSIEGIIENATITSDVEKKN